MATSLKTDLNLSGTITMQDDVDFTSVLDQVNIGTGTSGSQGFSEIKLALVNGTGDSQANEMFHDQRTVAATTSDNLDLAGTLTNHFGQTITFTNIKAILIRIISPDGTKSLRFGPRGVANAWQGPFGGTGANDYITVKDWFMLSDPYGMGAVTAGTGDLLGIYNPGAGSVTYDIIIIGTD